MLLQSKLITLMMSLSLKNQAFMMDQIMMTNQMISHLSQPYLGQVWG
jgi:hypothetical protein